MKNILKLLTTLMLFVAFSFGASKESTVLSGEAAISLSPNKVSKRIDFITKTFSTEDDNIVKKRSHKRRRKVRRPRQGR